MYTIQSDSDPKPNWPVQEWHQNATPMCHIKITRPFISSPPPTLCGHVTGFFRGNPYAVFKLAPFDSLVRHKLTESKYTKQKCYLLHGIWTWISYIWQIQLQRQLIETQFYSHHSISPTLLFDSHRFFYSFLKTLNLFLIFFCLCRFGERKSDLRPR